MVVKERPVKTAAGLDNSATGNAVALYRDADPVVAYRRYYAAEKRSYRRGSKTVAATWTRRDVPEFMRVDNGTTMR